MIGATVNHLRYGKGVVTKEEDGKIYANFESGDKIFPYISFEKYVTFENPELQKEILEKAKFLKAEQENIDIQRREEIKKSLEENAQKQKQRKSNDSKKYNSWIKLEGQQDERKKHDAISVKDGEKTLYILNYNRKPSGVKDGAIVFVAAGITDENGISQQVIVGRGILNGFNDSNHVRDEWIQQYEWMEYYDWFLVLKEYEVLDDARCKGLTLEQVFREVGADTYPTSEGQDVSLQELKKKHLQKMHLMITDKAVEYINGELDKLFRRYGVRIYRSER